MVTVGSKHLGTSGIHGENHIKGLIKITYITNYCFRDGITADVPSKFLIIFRMKGPHTGDFPCPGDIPGSMTKSKGAVSMYQIKGYIAALPSQNRNHPRQRGILYGFILMVVKEG